MDFIDISLINWSRAQFALTAMYHWLFVPLTLGVTFIIAIMETIYFKTGNPEWKKITKFWMTLFGINFAIGVATGIILEFEFGTNWSNYSWFVGDIFGAPLAIEGIMAFFLESTFIAVMFFGWEKVSPKYHLVSSWLVAFGSNLSALWILVANAWMQNPRGMTFNPDTARNEMTNFWDVIFSPTAIDKFLHTISSGYVLASLFVIGVSSWYLLKNKNIIFAKKSILVAAIFGLLSSVMLIGTGDSSAKQVAKDQPMKFAAMEGLYKGQNNAPLKLFGILGKSDTINGIKQHKFLLSCEVQGLLSWLASGNSETYIPGIEDIINGNASHTITSFTERCEKGKLAINALANYNLAKKTGNDTLLLQSKLMLDSNFQYFGYGYFNHPNDIIPNVPLTFYSFHIMAALGFMFLIIIILFAIFTYKNTIEKYKVLLWIGIISIPLAYLASQMGWVVAEVGRQPWVIQDLMPTISAVTRISTSAVQTTFVLFAILFTTLLIAEIKIMLGQIKKGHLE